MLTSRRALFTLASLAVLILAGCPKKFTNGECDTSEACKDQQGFGKVCVQGRCQECGGDGDCQPGFACKANKCQPRPECEGAADCASGKMCEAGRCVVDPDACSADRPCAPGKECKAGRCVLAEVAPVAAVTACDKLAPVFFGFDESNLTAEARATLEQNAKCIREKAAVVTVEGNCDERGTSEYNLHLGQRRADSVKKYVTGLGVPAKSVKAKSFGKQKPVCQESTEDCWQKNRRADSK